MGEISHCFPQGEILGDLSSFFLIFNNSEAKCCIKKLLNSSVLKSGDSQAKFETLHGNKGVCGKCLSINNEYSCLLQNHLDPPYNGYTKIAFQNYSWTIALAAGLLQVCVPPFQCVAP